MNTILVPFDGSDNAMRAMKQALSIFETGKLHIHLLHVAEPIRMDEVVFKDTLSGMREIEKEHEAVSLKTLAPAKSELQKAGVSHEVHARIGHPAQVIADFAKEFHCQMIVMGTRGLGTIKNLIIGSVANKVVHLADIPVLLVK